MSLSKLFLLPKSQYVTYFTQICFGCKLSNIKLKLHLDCSLAYSIVWTPRLIISSLHLLLVAGHISLLTKSFKPCISIHTMQEEEEKTLTRLFSWCRHLCNFHYLATCATFNIIYFKKMHLFLRIL